MKHQSYLIIEGVDLPLPNSYNLEFRDIEADTAGETEAGTIQRDIVRKVVIDVYILFHPSESPFHRLAKKSLMPFQVFFTPSINPDQNADKKVVISVHDFVHESDIPCHRFTKNSFIPFQIATVDSLIVSQIEISPSLNQSHFFHKRTSPAITAPIAIGTIPMARNIRFMDKIVD
jgi:hypothetical protein